jgi:hypothetical protein
VAIDCRACDDEDCGLVEFALCAEHCQIPNEVADRWAVDVVKAWRDPRRFGLSEPFPGVRASGPRDDNVDFVIEDAEFLQKYDPDSGLDDYARAQEQQECPEKDRAEVEADIAFFEQAGVILQRKHSY